MARANPPPHDLAVEESVLGAIMLDAGARAAVVEVCTAADFYRPAHANVFDAVVSLAAAGEPVDALSVVTELRRREQVAANGADALRAELIRLTGDTTSLANPRSHAERLVELTRQRRLLGWARELADAIMRSDTDRQVSALDAIAADAAGIARRRHLAFSPASEVTPNRPTWLWPGWLARGQLHLLVGRQGLGKTTFATWVVAAVSTGQALAGVTRDPLRCALLSLEESAERQAARLHAVRATLEQVVIVHDVTGLDDAGRPYRRSWRFPDDCVELEQLLVDQSISLLVIDGLGYAASGTSHNYGNVGSALSSLAAVAERTGASILGLTHPPKAGSDPVTAAIGSTAWTAVARVVWVLGIDPEDETERRRAVRVSKSNFKAPEAGVSFIIGDDEEFEAGYVASVRASNASAEALVAASTPAAEKTERDEAREFVRDALSGGPMDSADLIRAAKDAGISERTLKRARSDLGVRSYRLPDESGRPLGKWVAELAVGHKATGPQVTGPDSHSWPPGPVGTLRETRLTFESVDHQSAQSAHRARATLLDGLDDSEPF